VADAILLAAVKIHDGLWMVADAIKEAAETIQGDDNG
jgi:hypothetical protein